MVLEVMGVVRIALRFDSTDPPFPSPCLSLYHYTTHRD